MRKGWAVRAKAGDDCVRNADKNEKNELISGVSHGHTLRSARHRSCRGV